MENDNRKLADILHEGGYSCVIRNGGTIRTFTRRGVADLYDLLNDEPEFLRGAEAADKVVGKGAAILMVLGGIGSLYTDVISAHALSVFRETPVRVSFGTEVPHIENRDKTGWCPLERRCLDAATPAEGYTRIEAFIREMRGTGTKPGETDER